MKKLTLTIALAFIVLVSSAQYHIRVECDNSISTPEQYYTITYTTNNWLGLRNLQTLTIGRGFFTDDPNDLRTYQTVSLFQFYSPA